MERPILRILAILGLLSLAPAMARGGEVTGRISMPDTCSPSISPAVVSLEPLDGVSVASTTLGVPADVALINQHGLQFEPRVQIASVGQTIRFTNQDGETHNVHILTPGFPFNQSMKPNVPANFVPDKPGLVRLVCDIHSHMRGFVVVTSSPWAKVCKGGGSFHFTDVPAGRYRLNAWHEMGEPLVREIEVAEGRTLELGTLVLQSYPVAPTTATTPLPARSWPDVTDRIGILLAESRESVKKPNGFARARKLTEDAYWGEFESSDMETAVRRHLGFRRAGSIEGQFLKLRSAIKASADGKVSSAELLAQSRSLLLDLSRASDELRALHINDRRDVGQSTNQADIANVPGASEQALQLKALALSFRSIAALADKGDASNAASAMTDAYFNDFEPLERVLNARKFQEVAPLESRFNLIQGKIGTGLAGAELASELDRLQGEVVAALGRADASGEGSFGMAFANSLVTILREGVEVILLLTMLLALVAKAGQPRALVAIRWGIVWGVVASLLTAVGLNLLVSSTQGKMKEVVEGAVMLAAAGALFYVSYWLVSQSQAQRWTEFLKNRIAQGTKVGGLWTLGLTSFLAIYREGAETALLYQAMISGQGGSKDGLIGLAIGLLLGLIILAAVAVLIRKSSVKLPLRSFFKVTGFVLFGMAVVFAGNGVFELQNAGYLKVTNLEWMGLGVPALGLHPNIQTLSIQGLLALGAVLALILPGSSPSVRSQKIVAGPPASVGV